MESITKETPNEAPKDANGTPKKVRKKPSRKKKSETAGTSTLTAAEPQPTSSTLEQTNEKEDIATQMQRMLDEMRKKDPDLFKSILAANMVSLILLLTVHLCHTYYAFP